VTRLFDDDPHVFSAYLSCLYFNEDFMKRQTVEHRQGDPMSDGSWEDCENEDDEDKMIGRMLAKKRGEHAEHIKSVKFLIDVYILADKLLDMTSAVLVLEHLVTYVEGKRWTTDEATISRVYASTSDGSPLRKLVRDWWLFNADQSWALDRAKSDWDMPLEFMQDLIIETSRLRRAFGPRVDIFKSLVTTSVPHRYHHSVAQ
jgi:hypothetical protein